MCSMQQAFTCPRCGWQNHLGQHYCRACGGPLVTACPYCGADIDLWSRFCGNCGGVMGMVKQQVSNSVVAGKSQAHNLSKQKNYSVKGIKAIPPEIREQLLSAYISNPHPMLWRDTFSKSPDETDVAALERCYPKLFVARQRLYERNVAVEIDYYTLREEGFGARDFLHLVASKSSSKWR